MNIQIDQLRRRCVQLRDSFRKEGNSVETVNGLLRIHRDRGPNCKVLGVAHLDTVRSDGHFHAVSLSKKETIVYSSELDDRLGVYILLDLLPSVGVEVDILLTDGEESGRTTASSFTSNKEYNWIFSFDRRGDDVVMYCYDDYASMKLLKGHGFRLERGSFSCIAKMEFLKCKGFNFGCGYHNEHQVKCYASLRETYRQVDKFAAFWRAMKNVRLPHEESKITPVRGAGKGFSHREYEPVSETSSEYFNRTGIRRSETQQDDFTKDAACDWTRDEYLVLSRYSGSAATISKGCSNGYCHNNDCSDPCPSLKQKITVGGNGIGL